MASRHRRSARRVASQPCFARRSRSAVLRVGPAVGRVARRRSSSRLPQTMPSLPRRGVRSLQGPRRCAAALLHGNAHRIELRGILAADADAEVESPAGHDVERACQLGCHRRRVERQQGDAAEQLDALGGGGGGGERDERVWHGPVEEEVLTAEQPIEACCLDLTSLRCRVIHCREAEADLGRSGHCSSPEARKFISLPY
jgi:hypothetical protein